MWTLGFTQAILWIRLASTSVKLCPRLSCKTNIGLTLELRKQIVGWCELNSQCNCRPSPLPHSCVESFSGIRFFILELYNVVSICPIVIYVNCDKTPLMAIACCECNTNLLSKSILSEWIRTIEQFYRYFGSEAISVRDWRNSSHKASRNSQQMYVSVLLSNETDKPYEIGISPERGMVAVESLLLKLQC